MIRKPLLLVAALALGGCFVPTPAGMAPAVPPAPSPVASGGTTPQPAPTIPGDRPSAPPWFLPQDGFAQVEKAGLEALQAEGNKYHIHQHLSVYWDGAPVVVPAALGISPTGIWISPLHTHTADGIVHVEANEHQEIKLHQFFTEWGVAMGGASVYENGQPVADGANLVLKDFQAIAVVWGKPPAVIPDRYPVPATPTPAPNHPSPAASTGAP